MKQVWIIGLSLGLLASAPAHAQQTPSRTDSIAYVVSRGDTLIDLAAAYLARPADYRRLQQLNRVTNPRRLAVGRTLMMPVELLKADPDYGRIANFRGEVRLEHDGRASPAAVGRIVHEGDVLSTGPNAFTRLIFSDGSVVTVPSNGRVRVTRLRRYALTGAVSQELTVERGRAESTVAKRQVPGAFIVRTPVSVSSVRGTEFRSTFDEQAGRGVTEVLHGVVDVSIAEGLAGAVLEPGQGAAVANGLTRKVALLSAPDLATPDRIQNGRSLEFTLRSLPSAKGYRGRLATDAGMVDAFAEAGSPADQTRLTFDGVPDGAYFLRVTAVADEGVEGLPMTYDVMRIRNMVTDLVSSSERIGRRRFYKFRWREEGAGEARFRFQIWRTGDESTTPIIDQPGLTDTVLTLASLPSGDYSWRVQGARASFGRRVETWSEVQQLRISR